MIKAFLWSSGISDVVIASVHFEKTRLKKLMKRIIIINIMNNSFWRSPETDLLHESEARKVVVDFKFDALYR